MRIGIHVGVSGRSNNAVDELIDAARQAHTAGLDFWMPQMSDVDALSALAVVGREVQGLQVGTAVVPTYPRHPMVMAMQALTVQAATAGRLTLGIGLSHRVVIEGAYGLSFDKPVRHMREYLDILMPLLHEGKADVTGEELSAHTFSAMKPAGSTPPKVIVAALGSQMLNLAGSLADGTALWMVGPRTIESHIVPKITAAAQRSGRPDPQVVVGLPVSVTSDPDAARARAAETFGFYNNLPSYRAMLDIEGVEGPADVAIVGDEATVRSQLLRLGEIGATALSLPVFGSSDERKATMSLLAELAATVGS